MKLGGAKNQKRRLLAKHPARRLPTAVARKLRPHQLLQRNNGVDSAGTLCGSLPERGKHTLQKLAVEPIIPGPPAQNVVDLTVDESDDPNKAKFPPVKRSAILSQKRAACDSSWHDLESAKRPRAVDGLEWEPHRKMPALQSAKDFAAQNIAALAESVRSGRSGGQSTMDIVHADWEVLQRKPAAVSDSLEAHRRRGQPNMIRHPADFPNAVETRDSIQDQEVRQQARYFGATLRHYNDALLLRRKTMELQEEVALPKGRVSEWRGDGRRHSQWRSMENTEQAAGAVGNQLLLRESKQRQQGQQTISVVEHQVQQRRFPVDDSEALRRQRLANALFGSNTVSKTRVERNAEAKMISSTAQGDRANAPAQRKLKENAQNEAIRRTPAPLLAVTRPKPSQAGPQMMVSYQSFFGNIPSSTNAIHGASQEQTRFGGQITSLLSTGVDRNRTVAPQQVGAQFPTVLAPGTNSMDPLKQQQQQNFSMMGFQAVAGFPNADNSVDMQQFLLMNQRFQH